MDNISKNKSDDGQGEHLQLQQQRRRQSSSSTNFKAPEERPYRRRIKPPPAKVYHVHPARFRRFVQRRTCCSTLTQPNVRPSGPNSDEAATSAATNLLPQTPPDAAIGGSGRGRDFEGCLVVTRISMQDAYMAWCSSNDVPLSPGTMAELSFTEHPSNDQR